jgi:phage repressor protein C with HTH and peptisase S24 domain
MNLGDILRAKREKLGLTQQEVADCAEISKPYLSQIETGKVRNPPTDRVLTALERALAMQAGELTRLANLERTPADVRHEHQQLQAKVGQLREVLRRLTRSGERTVAEGLNLHDMLGAPEGDGSAQLCAGSPVPVINSVQAGYPQDFTDLDYPAGVADEYIRCPEMSDAQAFAARVVGDSMEPRYHQGDVVVFSPNTPVKNGADCFVRFEGGGTSFKRFYQDNPETVRLQPLNPQYPPETYPAERITGLWPAVYRIEKLPNA